MSLHHSPQTTSCSSTVRLRTLRYLCSAIHCLPQSKSLCSFCADLLYLSLKVASEGGRVGIGVAATLVWNGDCPTRPAFLKQVFCAHYFQQKKGQNVETPQSQQMRAWSQTNHVNSTPTKSSFKNSFCPVRKEVRRTISPGQLDCE